MNIGTIEGGTSPNLVPTHAIARADIRLPVGITTDVLAAKLDEWLAPLEGVTLARHPPLRALLHRARPRDRPAHRPGRRRGAGRRAPAVNMRVGGSDSRWYRQHGVPTVVLGLTPFNMGGPDEYVLVDELLAVAKIHTLTAFDFLSRGAMTMDRLSDDELFTSPLTFMGAPYGRPGPNNKAAILGIPFDCGTNMRIGARGGPDSVRQQSALMRRFNPTHADFDPVAALGLVDCGNVRLTPSKIVDAFERTEQAVDRIVAGRRRARSPSAATARSPSRSPARSARSTGRWRRCTSTRTPIPIPTARRRSTTRPPSSPMSPRRAWSIRNSPGMSASAARPTPRASCRAP